MRKMGKPLIAGGRRGKGCEFVLHVDLSDTDKACTMKMETVLGPRLLQKPVQDALLGPLLDHIYKPKVNGPMNVHVHATLEGDLPIDTTAPAREFEREDGMPVDIYVVVTQDAEPAGGESAPVDGGGRFVSQVPATGASFNLTIETADGFEHKGLPSDGSVLSTTLKPKWLRKPLQSALLAPFLDGLNGARPKGTAKLGIGNVLRVSGADGEPIGLEVVAASLITDENEPISLTVLFGEATGGGVPRGRASAGEQEVASVPVAGATFNLTIETADGFEHKGLPSDGSVLSTTLKPKWLRKPLQSALIAPFLDGLNGARPKGTAKLGIGNVRGVCGPDGEPIGLEVVAASLVTEDNEPISLKVVFGEATGSGRVPLGSLDEEEVASNASGEERPKVETLPRLQWLRKELSGKLGRGERATFHLHAGEVATKAILPKGALSKPLEDVLLAPFVERLQGKGGSFSIIDPLKLQSARIEVDGETVDLSKPAGSFVRDPNEPVVIVYRMDGDDTASEAGSDAPSYGSNYREESSDALSVGLADVALEGPLFTEAEPESPFGGSVGSEGSAAVFTTTHNNRALARARAARLSKQNSASSMGSMGSPSQRASNGSVTNAVTTNGLIDFGTQ